MTHEIPDDDSCLGNIYHSRHSDDTANTRIPRSLLRHPTPSATVSDWQDDGVTFIALVSRYASRTPPTCNIDGHHIPG